jgi:dipeptidyl aminopeptidase/acylaminoacyl peptidase
MEMATGTTPSKNINIFKQSSPVNFISKQSAPTLILHGSRDNIVDVSQSKILKQKLEEHGVANELIIFPNEGHGWYGTTLNKSFEKIESFLNDHVD